MPLNYKCPRCSKDLGYDGLCFSCKFRETRLKIQTYSEDEVKGVINNILNNLDKFADLKNPYFDDFQNLLANRDFISEKLQEVCFKARIFYPSEIYYKASKSMQKALLDEILKTEDSSLASSLLMCLAFAAFDNIDDESEILKTFYKLYKNPPKWRHKLYADTNLYAMSGGWSFDIDGKLQKLNYKQCLPLNKTDDLNLDNYFKLFKHKHITKEEQEKLIKDSPVKVAVQREDKCPHCKGNLFDILKVDARDERLKFLDVDGIITATCCLNCTGFLETPCLNTYKLDGSSKMLETHVYKNISQNDTMENYFKDYYVQIKNNNLYLAQDYVPPFYGAFYDDMCTIGGFANFVQDSEYTTCPKCNKYMRLLGQIHLNSLIEYGEGTLYIEFCKECQISSVIFQQT